MRPISKPQPPRWFDQTGGAALAVTRESKGISLFRKIDSQLVHTHVPTIPVAVYDVTGAGDAVAASLAIALASGIELEDACALANLAGRAVVRQFGVGTISIGHLLAEASQSVEQTGKVVDLARARRKCAKCGGPAARSCSRTAASTSSTPAMPICFSSPATEETS